MIDSYSAIDCIMNILKSFLRMAGYFGYIYFFAVEKPERLIGIIFLPKDSRRGNILYVVFVILGI